MHRLSRAIAAALLAVSVAACGAPASNGGGIKVAGTWTTATPPGAPSASGYMEITNTGSSTDRLTAVSSPLAAGAMLHDMDIANGIASMRMLDGIDIPAGKTITLAPNGLHIMFVTLKQPLKTGDSFPVVLTFAKAGKVEATLPVLPIGSRGLTKP